MMMAVMKRKAKILSEGTFGTRHQHGWSVHFSPCLCPTVSLMDKEMNLAVIQLFQTIWSKERCRSFF
uniref:Extra-large guanine nucleotide-binding protein 3-like n=1 Tax=Rhizophora mucronata TaxID=61149 RepID=A0A2P2JDB0_RHIMU